jgi:hypothetical protein
MENLNSATSLQAKILSLNNLNKDAILIFNHEKKQLLPYVGQNILKNDGSFKAKIKLEKLEIQSLKFTAYGFEWHKQTSYYFKNQYGFLSIEVTTCINGGGVDRCGVSKHCIYERQTFDLFKIDTDGKLQELETERNIFQSKDFEELEILENAKKVKEAAKVYEEILNAVPYEFRNVLYLQRLTN